LATSLVLSPIVCKVMLADETGARGLPGRISEEVSGGVQYD
jgi:hypothetical protein